MASITVMSGIKVLGVETLNFTTFATFKIAFKVVAAFQHQSIMAAEASVRPSYPGIIVSTRFDNLSGMRRDCSPDSSSSACRLVIA